LSEINSCLETQFLYLEAKLPNTIYLPIFVKNKIFIHLDKL